MRQRKAVSRALALQQRIELQYLQPFTDGHSVDDAMASKCLEQLFAIKGWPFHQQTHKPFQGVCLTPSGFKVVCVELTLGGNRLHVFNGYTPPCNRLDEPVAKPLCNARMA